MQFGLMLWSLIIDQVLSVDSLLVNPTVNNIGNIKQAVRSGCILTVDNIWTCLQIHTDAALAALHFL